MFARLQYYLSSIPTLFGQIQNWPVLFVLLFRKQPTLIQLKNGCQFRVRNLMDVWILKETCLDREYEKTSLPIQDGWKVIDIGAGMGDFSILTAREHPGCTVYAFEPFQESFDMLTANIALNAAANIRTFPIAISAKTGKMTLFATGEAVQHTTTDSTVSGDAANAMQVEGISLDDMFAQNQLGVCDYLKIDCEGGEYDILFHTSENTLRKIRHICMEYHDGFTRFSHTDLEKFLREHGFQVQTTPNRVHHYLGFLYAHR